MHRPSSDCAVDPYPLATPRHLHTFPRTLLVFPELYFDFTPSTIPILAAPARVELSLIFPLQPPFHLAQSAIVFYFVSRHVHQPPVFSVTPGRLDSLLVLVTPKRLDNLPLLVTPERSDNLTFSRDT